MQILGIHLDFPYVKTCLIQKGRRGIEFRELKTVSLSSPEPQKPEAAFGGSSGNVKRIYMEGFRGRVVTGLSARDFLMRPMEVKVAGRRHLEDAVIFQSEALSPFKPDEALTIPLIGKKGEGKVDALLFTVPRESLREHLRLLAGLHIDPDGVSAVPLALFHFVRWKFPKWEEGVVIDLGSETITCIRIEKGELKKSHAIPKGVEDLLAALHEDRKKILLKKEIEGSAKQIDLLLLKPGLNPRLSRELIELRQELAKILYAFGQSPVIFTGRSDAFMHLREFLGGDPGEDGLLSNEEQKYAICMGLALEQISRQSLQLRQEEFFPKKNWVQMGLYALGLLGTSLLLSAIFLGLGFRSIENAKQKILETVPSQNARLAEEQIDQWIETIESHTKEYPYILQAPKVGEILAWLSSHPLLEKFKKEGDPIDIREIRYQLESFPNLQSEKEPFVARVDLEFNFKNVLNARKFHEALRGGDDWIDPDRDIAWDALSESYRASFYLKNRGPYVP